MKRIILESRREAMKLSHEEAAKGIGISRPFYTQIENGTRDPSVKVARRIAEFFKITLDEIFLVNNVVLDNNHSNVKAS